MACSQARSEPTVAARPQPAFSASTIASNSEAPSRGPAASSSQALLGAPDAGADAAPSYDLAADLQARRDLARRDLGERATSAVVAGVYLLVFPEGPSQSVADARAREGERIVAAFLDGRFAQKPFRAISAYLFTSSAAYQAFCHKNTGKACMSPYGYYEPEDRRILMNGAGLYGTFTHEIVHTFVEADFPEAPTWLNEGIASVFEQPYFDGTGIHGAKNWRLPRLMSGLAAEPATVRLGNLFVMSDETFRGPKEDLNYAFARYVCQWLDTQGMLWPFYHRYRDTFVKDATGIAALVATVGKRPEELDAPFRTWLRAL